MGTAASCGNGAGCGLSPPEVVGDPRGWGRGRMGLVEALVVGHPPVLGAQGTGYWGVGTPGVLVVGRTGQDWSWWWWWGGAITTEALATGKIS